MRAVIYARFSTAAQRETSIDDQARVCRARIDTEGWIFGGLFSDIETSGRSIISERAGAAQMLAAIAAGGIDIIVLESLDRLARDLVEQETQVRRLEHRGLRIIGLADGYDTQLAGRELMRAVRGAINEGYIRDLSHKTHRGLDGQIERGFHAGGLSYGYRSIVAGVDNRGEPIGHRLVVDELQAHWVRWIFTQYADGMSCQKIAAHLNHLRVPGPRGGTWCVSALYGSPDKGSGVLNNELYVGRYIWNRSRWLKDPDTRKRTRLVRPKAEWKVMERPELRILDEAAWQRVRDRMDKPKAQGGPKRGRPARTLFGGLLRCGICGGAVVATDTRAYGCSAHKDRGRDVCTGVTVPRQALDVRLMGLVRDEMLAPSAIASVRRSLNAALTRKDRQGSRDAAQKRLREVQREIANVAEAIANIGYSDALRERLQASEAEQKRLQRELAPVAAAKPTVDDLMAGYRKMLMDLSEALKRDTERARPLLRQALGEVKILREGEAIYAEIAPTEQRLLLAAGGDASKSGCGDMQPELEAGKRYRIK